jgi:hypothetical protein
MWNPPIALTPERADNSRTDPQDAEVFGDVAFDKSTTVQKVMHYGPSRRSSMIASEIGG